ncbi:unnamed protein product [Gongylonema pulchrum]|uniref:MUTSd domain-containing protein n=1 Tax=Gongylonema pulchrum TaxID=637853 RepID=A0A183DTI8_9BILA|nr:unnamed protein product [Gongylonema pulchrum]
MLAYLFGNGQLFSMVLGEVELTYHILNSTQYLRIVRDAILVKHYRVEVYAARDGQWELKAKGSLGCSNDFEEIFGESAELYELTTVAALAISAEQHNSAEKLNWIARNGTMHIMPLCLLSKCFTALVPHECIIIPSTTGAQSLNVAVDDETNVHLKTVLKRAGVKTVPFQFGEEEVEGCSEKVLTMRLSKTQESCIFALMEYLHLNDDSMPSRNFQLRNYKSAGYMYLNSAAVRALELFSTSQEDESSMADVGSLYEFLNKCRTPQGQRLLRDWIRRPLYDIRKINERLDVVEAFVGNTLCRTLLHDDILRRIPDIAALTRKMVQKKAGLQECHRLYKVICMLKRFQQTVDEVYVSCGDWIRRPLYDIRKINERLDVVEAFVGNTLCRTLLHDDILRRIPDIAALTRKMVQKKAGLQECHRLYKVICMLKRFQQTVDEVYVSCGSLAPSVNDLCLEPLSLAQLQFEKFVTLIETTVDITYWKKSGVYRILPNIDENLLAISERIQGIEKECNVVLKKLLK